MATLEQWLDLARRIEASDGPDPRLDREIISLLGLRWPGLVHWFNVTRRKEADFTGSIDAAAALIGMVLAHHPVDADIASFTDDGLCGARICERTAIGTAKVIGASDAVKPSNALSAAFCRAMAAMEAGNGNV